MVPPELRQEANYLQVERNASRAYHCGVHVGGGGAGAHACARGGGGWGGGSESQRSNTNRGSLPENEEYCRQCCRAPSMRSRRLHSETLHRTARGRAPAVHRAPFWKLSLSARGFDARCGVVHKRASGGWGGCSSSPRRRTPASMYRTCPGAACCARVEDLSQKISPIYHDRSWECITKHDNNNDLNHSGRVLS